MDINQILIILAVVVGISLILRIFFAITKVIIILLIIAALAAGTFFFVKGKINPTPNTGFTIEQVINL